MKRRGGNAANDPHQLKIDWSAPGATIGRIRPPDETPIEQPPVRDWTQVPANPAEPGLLQRLPWDFQNSFPSHLPHMKELGFISDEEETPEHLRKVHEMHAHELLRLLHDLDVVLDARRRGIDPDTNQKPGTPKEKQALARRFELEPPLREKQFLTLIGAYEDHFGPEAADAFDKAIRARHAGIPVVADRSMRPQEQGEDLPAPPGSERRVAAKNAGAARTEKNPRHREGRRVVARLPIPKPLPHAVAAGNFGQDERGPVRPSAGEVREITENHAALLVDLIAHQRETQRSRSDDDNLRLSSEIQAEVQKYAEDFGEHAAKQLLAYARRQVLITGNAPSNQRPQR